MSKLDKRAFKNRLYEQFARIGKALSSAHRLELLEVLAQGEHSVEVLAQETGMSVANASQHLQVLRAAQLVDVRREGVYIYLHERTRLQPISAAELRQRLAEGDVILLDVRPTEEYQASHLPGALSMPVTDLAARLSELPRGKEIVAYCRGPYCVFADEAVALLQTNGYQARRLEEGLPDWRALGLPVESGTGAQP